MTVKVFGANAVGTTSVADSTPDDVRSLSFSPQFALARASRKLRRFAGLFDHWAQDDVPIIHIGVIALKIDGTWA